MGVASSFFLNISIGYFPLVFYSTVFIIIFFHKQIYSNIKKSALMIGTTSMTVAVINIPMIASIILGGSSHSYTNFTSYKIIDALTAGIFYYSKLELGGIFLSGVVLLLALISRITIRLKVVLILIYLMVSLILMGKNITPSLYDFIFYNFPLMNSIRSTHRFIFYELFIIIIFIYSGLSHMLSNKNLIVKGLGGLFSIVMLYLLGYNIFLNNNYIQTSILPTEYFEVDSYLQNSTSKIMYFPSYMPVFHDLNGNFSWMPVKDAPLGLIYANPFTSLLSVENMTHVETYMTNLKSQELNALTHYNNSPSDVIKALEYAGIERLIIDKNFLWNKVFPDFDLNEFEKKLKLKKQFGNIFIYDVSDKQNECIKSYGNFKLGYCIDDKNPQVFIERTKNEYVLDFIAQSGNPDTIPFNRSRDVIHLIIANPSLTEYVVANKILITTPHMHVDEPMNNIYLTTIKGNKYLLALPILRVDPKTKFFGDMQMEIVVNGVVKMRIYPYNTTQKFAWEQLVLDLSRDQEHIISIQTKGDGAMVFGSPVLMELTTYQKLLNNLDISSIDSRLQRR
jgi:hypothetical protein